MATIWCCSQCGAVYHKDYARCPGDGAEVVVAACDPLLGVRLDRYWIEELIGEGGMGRVYLARHTHLSNKRFALKVLLGDAAVTDSMRKRFLREAESTSRLAHPNIVSVIDYGEMSTSGLPYLVMDYVEGTTLYGLFGKPMDPARVVRIARAVCEGLAHAHSRGVIHRDLKPENILIDRDDVPHIVDFGLALTGDVRLTSTGMAMGTPAYAAPEQLAGLDLDQRADLYSLGMTMYEALTGGELPFEDRVDLRMQIDTPALAERVVVPPGLEAIVMKLVSRRRSERFIDAWAVIDALDALADDGRAATEVNAPSRPRWRKPALGAALLAAAVVTGFAMIGGHREVAAVAAPPPPNLEIASFDVQPPAPRLAPRVIHKITDDAKPRSRKIRSNKRTNIVPAEVAMTPVVAVAAPLPAPPEVPRPALPLHAAIAGLDVDGALPVADVRRATMRLLPALERCRPAVAETVVVTLRIDESRRASAVRASGGTASSCVSAALGALRTESAPDVGDVRVRVSVAFGAGT